MNSAPSPSSEVRIGEWSLDLQTGDLRKSGIALRLQEQPLQILQILLENPGAIVSREELHKRMWPADTFVDFDHGLYSAIKRLRDALGDSTAKPKYIETLARRGYRLIAAVVPTVNTFPNAPLQNETTVRFGGAGGEADLHGR